MALIEYNIFGSRCDKVKMALDRIRAFVPDEGYFVAFSGGKDSSQFMEGWRRRIPMVDRRRENERPESNDI